MRRMNRIPGLPRIPKGRAAGFAPQPANDRLTDLDTPFDNPGNLRARCYVPEGLPEGAPIVVVLHGCTQSAAVYDHGSGWSTLADRRGFALLYPEQQRANNPMLCFNWFSQADAARGAGEAASIKAMIEAMCATHGIDPARVFVTGLSAGGAMTAVMLAAYPEIFAAGSIIAGLPFGCASGAAEAFECMGGRTRVEAAELGARVRRASRHSGAWPRLQVWQGSADSTVVPGNADAIVRQWANLHGLPAEPDRTDRIDGHPRRVWLGASGTPVIEQYSIAGMAHGVPLDGAAGPEALGAAGAHMLDVGIHSTLRIADFFGIPAAPATAKAPPKRTAETRAPLPVEPRRMARPRTAPRPEPASGVQAVIEKALRAAGLMS